MWYSSSMFIDLVREVELLDSHGVNSCRKPADQRAPCCLKSSSQARREWRTGSILRCHSCWEQTVVEEKASSGERNRKDFFFFFSCEVCPMFFILCQNWNFVLMPYMFNLFRFLIVYFWYSGAWSQSIRCINAKSVLPLVGWSTVLLYKHRVSVSRLSRFTYSQSCTFVSFVYGWKGVRKETVLR